MLNFSLYFKKIGVNKYELAANRFSRKRYLVSNADRKEIISLLESLSRTNINLTMISVPIIFLHFITGFILYILLSIINIYKFLSVFNYKKGKFEIKYVDREPFLLIYKTDAIQKSWKEILGELKIFFVAFMIFLLSIFSYLDNTSHILEFYGGIFFGIAAFLYLLIIILKLFYKMKFNKYELG